MLRLCDDLNRGRYRHGGYNHKIVNEKKRRDIAVANVRDRVMHRLLYDYLVPIVDPRLDFDVWSCRPGKGLHKALSRTRQLATRHAGSWIWRADIEKFFDNVHQRILYDCLSRIVRDTRALSLMKEVILSYSTGITDQVVDCDRDYRRGIPIGNLTSQIFANIYLHEFDRYVRHGLQPKGYVRYGDDFILFFDTQEQACLAQRAARTWLSLKLSLSTHHRNNVIIRPRQGIHFLGHNTYSRQSPRIDAAMSKKIDSKLDSRNIASYQAMLLSPRQKKQLPWLLRDKL